MKTVIRSLLLFLICFHSNAQDQVTIKLKNTKGQPLKNVEVTANNQSANDLVKGITDTEGKVTLALSAIGTYSLSYLDQKDFDTYEVKEGLTGIFSRTVTYDPEEIFVPKPKADRTGVQFVSVGPTQLKGKAGVMKLTVRVNTTKREPVPGAEVVVVSVADKIKFKGRSDAGGNASFYVPANKSYDIDIDGNEALKTIDLPNMPGSEMTHFVFYEKLRIAEIAKGDTIIQRNITQDNGTSTHLLFKLKLLDYQGVPLEGESVYLQEEGKSRVYETLTDKKGECQLMVQKGANYILNLKYEQGLHLVEAEASSGFGNEALTRRYRGSAEIERILAEQEAEMKRLLEQEAAMRAELEERKKREKELVLKFYEEKFVPTFRDTPVQDAGAPTNYLTRNSDGFDIEFNSSGPIGTPTIINDKMYIPAGYYSPNFYCLNAATGGYEWGVELGESGASPAVYSNGVILINTYSCTLYALDAKSGRLLWSKWLAGTVYSTPTADGDKVYVVFRYGGAYVLSCFDLRSGDFKWINRVDSETIACPVLEGNEVHVASQSGSYYIFDKETGKPIEVLTSVVAVSSPTITEQSIFLTARVDGKDRLIEIDRSTYEVKKKYEGELNPIMISRADGCQGTMNFNGSHPIVYKNKYVVLADHERLQVFDAESEKVLWEKKVSIATSQVPIVADDRIILATSQGEVLSFDITNGTSKQIRMHKEPIDAQPVYNKGMLFVVSSGILSAIRSVHDFQWNQWNKDAGHNLRID